MRLLKDISGDFTSEEQLAIRKRVRELQEEGCLPSIR